jgi:hypothetical protein
MWSDSKKMTAIVVARSNKSSKESEKHQGSAYTQKMQ